MVVLHFFLKMWDNRSENVWLCGIYGFIWILTAFVALGGPTSPAVHPARTHILGHGSLRHVGGLAAELIC